MTHFFLFGLKGKEGQYYVDKTVRVGNPRNTTWKRRTIEHTWMHAKHHGHVTMCINMVLSLLCGALKGEAQATPKAWGIRQGRNWRTALLNQSKWDGVAEGIYVGGP